MFHECSTLRRNFCSGVFLCEKISDWVYFACSPELAVGNFTPTCCEPAFGKARLSQYYSFFWCVSFRLFLWEFCYKCCFFVNSILAFLLSGGLL